MSISEKEQLLALAKARLDETVSKLMDGYEQAPLSQQCDLLIARIDAIQAYGAEVSAICAR